MKYKSILKYAAAAFLGLAALSACKTEDFDEVDELNLTRCLEPMNLDARVNASLGDVVTFSWDVAKDADSYLLNIYTDAALTTSYSSVTLEPSQVPYTVKLEADATFYFTVQAKKEGKTDSKVATYPKAIKTYAVKDNLYLNRCCHFLSGNICRELITVCSLVSVCNFADNVLLNRAVRESELNLSTCIIKSLFAKVKEEVKPEIVLE